MKVILSEKFKAPFFLAALFLAFLIPSISEAADLATTPVADQLKEIQKKLDASKEREEKILATQEKILAEILTSRKWAKRQ